LGVLPSAIEVVTSFSTSINTQGTFTTDSNGFEYQQRKFVYDLDIQGNYYPLVYSSYINDMISQLSVISERSHGASSLLDGELEVMIHRNPDEGDGFGPGLTDTDEVYPSLRVLPGSPQVRSLVDVHLQEYLFNFPLQTYFASATSQSSFSSQYTTSWKFLTADLPPNIHLLSFNFLSTNTYILRLTHIFATDEDLVLSKPVTLYISNLFPNVKVSSLVETTLTANTVLVNPSPSQITIYPKEIRTFVIQFSNPLDLLIEFKI